MFRFPTKVLLLAVITDFTANAVQFNCVYNSQTITLVGSVYTCVPTVTLSGSSNLENVTGVHLPGYTNDNVEQLFIQNQNLPFVPEGIVIFFKNLRALRHESTNLVSISAKDLQPFPKLEYLTLYMNNLTSLDGDLFSYTPLLGRLFLSNNRIQHIGHDLVTNLNNLQYLYLQSNVCINRNAAGRADIVELAPQLSVLCPPLDVITTTTTTTTTIPVTTTELPIEQCPCGEEIDELREIVQDQNQTIVQMQQSNDQLVQANEKLFELNAVIEKRLLEVEMKLLEILSLPCSN